MAVFDNGVHFARESALAPIRALLPQEDRKALGALVVLYLSLSFANNEFTFANNFRLNMGHRLLRDRGWLFLAGTARPLAVTPSFTGDYVWTDGDPLEHRSPFILDLPKLPILRKCHSVR
jgi:hypothetical protein